MKKIILVICVIIVGAAVYWFAPKSTPQQAKVKPKREEFQSLFKLAQKQDPKALEIALEKSKMQTLKEQEEAAVILGFFDNEESNQTLQSLLSSEHEKVKVRAIYAIAQIQSPARVNILINQINSKTLKDREKTHLYTSLLRTSLDDKTTDLSVDHLIYITKYAKEETTRQIASSTLSQLNNPHKKVDALFKKLIFGKNEVIAANGVRYLANNKNTWFKSQVNTMLNNSNTPELVKLSLIETLHLTCIPERYTLFERLLQSGSARIRLATISQLNFHKTKQVEKMLSQFLNTTKIEKEKKKTQKTLDRLKNSTNRCG